jgi:hypothetical protein
MKIVPILAVTNALVLALALYLYVKLDDVSSKVAARRSEVSRLDPREMDELKARIADLEHARSLAVSDGAASAPEPDPHASTSPRDGGSTDAPALATPGADAPPDGAVGGDSTEINPQEMEVFRRKVKKANELNDLEEQKNRVIERIDQLVKDNKIAPLTPREKEGIATTVLEFRKRTPLVWQKLRETGALDNATREDRGRIIRSEMDALRAEAQRSLEEFMSAADAKTYLDESLREMQRGFGAMQGGFGGRDGGAPPAPPSPGNR